MQTATLPFDEIEPVIAGHAVVMSFLSGEVEYWTDYDGQPYVKAIYVERADRNGMVALTAETVGPVFLQSLTALFNSDSWIELANERLAEERDEDRWPRLRRTA